MEKQRRERPIGTGARRQVRRGEEGAALHHDLDVLAGTWDEDPEFDRVIAEQDRLDEAT